MGKFPITSSANDFYHTPDEIDEILDRYNLEQFSDEDDEILIEYAIHLLYKNGKTETEPNEIIEKIQLLALDRVITSLKNKGLVDCDFGENGEILTSLTQLGKEVHENLVCQR